MLKRLAVCTVILCIAIPACEKSTVSGPDAKKLTLMKPANQTIPRGGSEKVAVSVTRHNFSGPVQVDFSNLPAGVKVADTSSELTGNERTFVLTASDNADLVSNHKASVSVRGPEGMTATEEFEVTVREKK